MGRLPEDRFEPGGMAGPAGPDGIGDGLNAQAQCLSLSRVAYHSMPST